MRIYRSEWGREAVARWCLDQLDAWAVTHERHVHVVQGASTHVVTAGSGDPTVVVVPGTNFSAAACLPCATALSARTRVVLPDIPGQPGLSGGERVPARRRLAWYGQWLTELIDQNTEGPVVVVGHSLGAAITLASSAQRVTRQVLVSPGGLQRLRITPAVLAASVAWMVRRRNSASARLLQVMSAPGHDPRPEVVDWMTLLSRHVRSSLDPGQAVIADQHLDRAVLVGAHDAFLPAARLAPRVRHALGVELDVIPSAGHLVMDERPQRIAALTTH